MEVDISSSVVVVEPDTDTEPGRVSELNLLSLPAPPKPSLLHETLRIARAPGMVPPVS